ncbi:thioesterase [Afipia sp. P52-10]|uniref:PaaI family thioesterase n=1 Tax=Afipia sp. P52-10 TaxID=1429916 RepID=UPI0003DF05A8|nr:PaaI family thioesterase [Afipia sp. P52-10]ETR75765.1 thioesterase [Afipia sp. P52-10]
MSVVPKDAVARHDGAVQATSGEFAGWWTWTRDRFETANGPFWHHDEGDRIKCAFRVEKKHMNGSGAVHGGCLMTFADYCLFALSNKVLLDARGVTLSFSSEFIDAVYEGELVEGTGEVVRAGRSIVFMRGMLSSAGRPVLSFSGTVKRINAPRKPV